MALKWLSIVTGFFYIVLGVFIILKQWFIIQLELYPSYGLGAIMISYGIFRMIRAYYRLKEIENEE